MRSLTILALFRPCLTGDKPERAGHIAGMRDLLYPPHQPEIADPIRRSQAAMRVALPKRFYRSAAVEQQEARFAVTLDGRTAKTPGRNRLDLPTGEAAAILAAEWNAQAGEINPAMMPATRIVNSAIDSVANEREAVQADIANYAGSDLVCYRAEEPDGLASRQAALWDPVLGWARESLGVRFVLSQGIVFAEQPAASLMAVRASVAMVDDSVALAALHVMTTLSGSALIPLMIAAGALSPDRAWEASQVDEDWNAALWGRDAEAEARNQRRRTDFMAAAALFAACRGGR
jgi:chaperone required for assembly of F1-ATPase